MQVIVPFGQIGRQAKSSCACVEQPCDVGLKTYQTSGGLFATGNPELLHFVIAVWTRLVGLDSSDAISEFGHRVCNWVRSVRAGGDINYQFYYVNSLSFANYWDSFRALLTDNTM